MSSSRALSDAEQRRLMNRTATTAVRQDEEGPFFDVQMNGTAERGMPPWYGPPEPVPENDPYDDDPGPPDDLTPEEAAALDELANRLGLAPPVASAARVRAAMTRRG